MCAIYKLVTTDIYRPASQLFTIYWTKLRNPSMSMGVFAHLLPRVPRHHFIHLLEFFWSDKADRALIRYASLLVSWTIWTEYFASKFSKSSVMCLILRKHNESFSLINCWEMDSSQEVSDLDAPNYWLRRLFICLVENRCNHVCECIVISHTLTWGWHLSYS